MYLYGHYKNIVDFHCKLRIVTIPYPNHVNLIFYNGFLVYWLSLTTL